jgi:hypothetical protein
MVIHFDLGNPSKITLETHNCSGKNSVSLAKVCVKRKVIYEPFKNTWFQTEWSLQNWLILFRPCTDLKSGFFWAGWTSQIRLMMNGRKNNWEGIEKKDFLCSKQSCSIYLFNNGFYFVCLSSEIIVIWRKKIGKRLKQSWNVHVSIDSNFFKCDTVCAS